MRSTESWALLEDVKQHAQAELHVIYTASKFPTTIRVDSVMKAKKCKKRRLAYGDWFSIVV